MSATVTLIYNCIVKGKFYNVGQPIEKAILPANLHKFIAKPTRQAASESSVRQLNFDLNRPYSVDSDGYLRGSPNQQAAQMEAEASEDEMIADELAEAEVSETVASAVEQAREDYYADVERQKLQASVKTKRQEAAEDFLREEQDAAVQNGDFDQWNVDALRQSPERPAGAESVKSKPMAKPNSYVRRAGQFVPAASVELIVGERLYRFRKRKFGQSEKFIRYGTVKERKANHVQTS